MALSLGQGFAPYLLKSIADIAKENNPQYKLEPFGLLNLLQAQGSKREVQLNDDSGHKKTIRVKQKQRLTKDFTDTTKSCDQTNVIPVFETDVDINVIRQIAIYRNDEQMAAFMNDATESVSLGTPATPIMRELFDDILASANAILDGVNSDLWTLAAANIGVNRRTGVNTATTINLSLATTTNPLSDGETQILADYKNNGGIGRPQVVGSGLMYNYFLQQAFKTGFQSNGIDTKIAAGMFDFYHDLQAASSLGSNQVIVYQPNAVQLVEYMEYTGFKAGVKPGASTFFTMLLPTQNNFGVSGVEFDVQLKYADCPQTLTDAYYGTSLSLQKGWNIIISKQCGLWTIPAASYRATDVLNGNRGSLRYTITNA